MSRRIKLFLVIALLISLNLPAVARTGPASPAPVRRESTKEVAFRDAMRKLWEDHITWTRVFIISAAADLPDKVHEQILHMADMLSAGIVKQHPQKFK